MINFDLGYLFVITAGLAVCYFAFYYFIYYYHTNTLPRPLPASSAVSVAIIVGFSLLVYLVSFQLPGVNDGIGNRVIHSMGGGFAGMLVCYLVARDSRLKVSPFKYFIFCFMLVTTLGVFNEIVESVMQNVYHLTSAITINDTWFDLISNTIGAILGGLAFTPLLKK